MMTVVIDGTTGIDTGTGSLISANATTPTYLDLFEDTDNGSNYVRLIAPTSVAANRTITLPDGTGTVVVNNVSSAIVSDTAKTATSTSVDFTGIPSWAKRITVMFNGVSTSGSSNILIQLGDSGGIENTGYASNADQAGTGVNSTAGFITTRSIASTSVNQGLATIGLISTNAWVISGALGRSDAASGSFFAGSKTLSDTLTQVRITTVNGTDTFDAGTINILWE